jgi:hypothetical protein
MKIVEIRYVDMDKLGAVDCESKEDVNLWADFEEACVAEERMEAGEKVFAVVDKYVSQPDGRKFAWVKEFLAPATVRGLEEKRKAIRRQIARTARSINAAEMREDFSKEGQLQKKFNRLAKLNEETVRYQQALGGI